MRRFNLLVMLVCSACASPTTPSDSLDGQWVGTYLMVSCTPTGWPSCDSDSSQPRSGTLRLTLSGQNGSGVLSLEPYLVDVPVTGSILAETINLTGSVVVVNTKAFVTRVRITDWRTTRQDGSLMQGTFHLREETIWGVASPPYYPPGETWTYDYDAAVTVSHR